MNNHQVNGLTKRNAGFILNCESYLESIGGFMQVLITIQDDSKALKFLDFLRELSFLEIQKISENKTSTKMNKLPDEFYKPIRVENFSKFNRQEIYAETLH